MPLDEGSVWGIHLRMYLLSYESFQIRYVDQMMMQIRYIPTLQLIRAGRLGWGGKYILMTKGRM